MNIHLTKSQIGLDGVPAAETVLSHVDGEAGQLILAGYAVENLAPHAGFEDVAYLFLNGRLPTATERARFAEDLAGRRGLSGHRLIVSCPAERGISGNKGRGEAI